MIIIKAFYKFFSQIDQTNKFNVIYTKKRIKEPQKIATTTKFEINNDLINVTIQFGQGLNSPLNQLTLCTRKRQITSLYRFREKVTQNDRKSLASL